MAGRTPPLARYFKQADVPVAQAAQELSDRVKAKGGKASPKYLEHIAHGLMEPGWGLCFILGPICGIDPHALKRFPYKYQAKKRAA